MSKIQVTRKPKNKITAKRGLIKIGTKMTKHFFLTPLKVIDKERQRYKTGAAESAIVAEKIRISRGANSEEAKLATLSHIKTTIELAKKEEEYRRELIKILQTKIQKSSTRAEILSIREKIRALQGEIHAQKTAIEVLESLLDNETARLFQDKK